MNTTIKVKNKDRDWLEKQKLKNEYSNMGVVLSKMIQLIKQHKMEDEI